jgi:uncharacterized protein YbjT (DUF2867 family)
MSSLIVTVVGGTGFLGRYVVQELARAGHTVQVIARHAEQATYLKMYGFPGQIVLQNGDVTKSGTLKEALKRSQAVVNLVGVLYERGKRQRFSTIHAQCPEQLAKIARECGIRKFVHVSALGVDQAVFSHYARTKATGEKAVMASLPSATILRPSVIFGPEDNFYNQFARMASISPALPLIGGGKTKFQPVYVGDVARAVVYALTHKEAEGQVYECVGPRVYTFREILEYIQQLKGTRRCLLPIPNAAAKVIGFFGEWLPKPPLTRDQVRLLRHDNISLGSLKGFKDMGMTPAAVESIVPTYLIRHEVSPIEGHKITTADDI